MKFTVVNTFPAIVAAILAKSATAKSPKNCAQTDAWDVVVVGAGTAGSIVSAELATKFPGKCVLVLEAGKHSGQVWKEGDYDVNKLPASQIRDDATFFENTWTAVHESPETAWNTPGTYDILPCWAADCEYVWNGRSPLTAKIVGGGSSINGALMQYPNPENWDVYPEGWKVEDMEPFLNQMRNKMPSTSYPSADGIHYNDEYGPNIVKEAMAGIGYKYMDDGAYFMPTAKHMGIPRVCAVDGRRESPASVYLAPALEQSNAYLWTEAEATKIILNSKATKATGIDIIHEGKAKTIKLADNGLVVVSGGGVMTPEVLLASDIGEGKKVKNDAVGKGLTDKVVSEMTFEVKGMNAYELDPPTKENQELYVQKSSGPLAQFGPLLAGFIDVKIDDTEDGKKNTMEFFVSASLKKDEVKVFFVHFTPKKATDGGNFDRDYSTKSFEKAMGIVADAMKKLNKTYVQTNTWFPLNAMNHPAGTCELGKCVDEKTMIVKGGVENIAVVDNSLLPEQAVVHSVFTLMAIALKSSDILKNFWGENDAAHDEL